MTRAEKGNQRYWNEWIDYRKKRLDDMWEQSRLRAGDPAYAPQYMFELARNHWHLMFCLYSRGDAIYDLMPLFEPMLDAWEESIRLGQEVWPAEQQIRRQAWKRNFDHYIACFWLVGLALSLEVSDKVWNRLIALIGNEGEDILLDRIIASRTPGRRIGTELCFSRPYERLLAALDATGPHQGKLLAEFVEHWYEELAGQASPSYPYWHKLGDQNFEEGAYFGRWCVEAVAAAKAFGIDDSLCLSHRHYPGDLLRPAGMVEPDKRAMKVIEQIAWSHTLYEADDGSYLLAVVVPARDSAWATYEIEHPLSAFEKFLVRHFPGKVKRIAARVLDQEKRSQVPRNS